MYNFTQVVHKFTQVFLSSMARHSFLIKTYIKKEKYIYIYIYIQLKIIKTKSRSRDYYIMLN